MCVSKAANPDKTLRVLGEENRVLRRSVKTDLTSSNVFSLQRSTACFYVEDRTLSINYGGISHSFVDDGIDLLFGQ